MNSTTYKICFISLLLFFFFPSRIYAEVLINEIYPKPSDELSEWIELYNTAETPVSLNLWKLENISGEKKSFTINASAIIQGHGFLIFPKSQTSLSLNNNGDTVTLINAQGEAVDSQSFFETLGYNTSVGRSPDGGIAMTICASATPDAKNDCPVPTQTSTPLPTQTDTPVLTPTVIPVETVYQNTNNPSDESIPRIIHTPTIAVAASAPLPTLAPGMLKIEIPKSIIISKMLIIQTTIVVGTWVVLAGIAHLRGKRKKKKITQQT